MQLSLEHVGKTVGPAVHLYPQSLSLAPGAVTVLLGATQAGKTSLMRVMAGLDVATTGRACRCASATWPWSTSSL